MLSQIYVANMASLVHKEMIIDHLGQHQKERRFYKILTGFYQNWISFYTILKVVVAFNP